jgi:hypothetical protein
MLMSSCELSVRELGEWFKVLHNMRAAVMEDIQEGT